MYSYKVYSAFTCDMVHTVMHANKLDTCGWGGVPVFQISDIRNPHKPNVTIT